MAYDAHKNFAYSTVATAPSPASSGTSLVVAAGDGARFPAAPFNATVWPASAQPTSANAEVVRVTAVATDTLTITRAQEGSSARSIVVGDQIAATVTAKMVTDIETVAPNALTTTSLPASPVDGQVIFFQADSANGVVWQLRYNAGSGSAYKWEFVGGPPLVSEVAADETTTSGTYTDLATVGPSVTIPVGGDFQIHFLTDGYYSSAGQVLLTTVKLGAAAAADGDCIQQHVIVTSGEDTFCRTMKKTGLAAAAVLKVQYRNGGVATHWLKRGLFVTPIRVG